MPSSEVLAAILRATPEALLAVDGGGSVVFANDQAAVLLGGAAEDLVGLPLAELAPTRTTIRRLDGTEVSAAVSHTPTEAGGREPLVVVVLRPIGDEFEVEAERRREALLAQREQLSRLEALGQLAGGVAHDFNNLLGVILNYTVLLGDQLTDDAALGDLDEIRKAAERAAELTRQLLAFARRESSKPEPVDLGMVVEELRPELEECLGGDVDLEVDVGDGTLVASADRRQVEQVLLDLALNAREAMPTGGLVRLRLRSEAATGSGDDHVVLELQDTGEGMADDVAARAFEPFFTTKPDREGHGLGLATAHGIVKRHGGRISLDAEPGVGTRVRIELPAAPARTPEPDPGEARIGRGRILLAEDEDALRNATGRILTAEGYEVLAARDGVEAIEIFEREGGAVDLLLSDVVMPRMRGDELARELVDRSPSLPVVLVSGYDFGDAALPGRLLDKPVRTDDLLRTIRDVLGG